jgi:ribosomal protein S4E
VFRVISKKIENGKLYNKKLRVIDVLNDSKFSATPINSSSHLIVYTELREKDIETVIPKDQNEEVLILKGEFKGETGKILSRDRKKDEVIL